MGSGASSIVLDDNPNSNLQESLLKNMNPDDATGEELAFILRSGDRSPWVHAKPPIENDDSRDHESDETKRLAGVKRFHYMTWWCRVNKSWSLVLEEHDQPPWPITGGFRGAFKASKRSQWSLESSRPLIARCPAGSSNPGGWVRSVDAIPRSGRHYWEIRYQRGSTLPGKPLNGTFMTGLFNNKRLKYDWNSGMVMPQIFWANHAMTTYHHTTTTTTTTTTITTTRALAGIRNLWGVSSGKWRRKESAAVLICNGRVRDLSFEEFDLEDEVLNASGVVHGQGERLGVLVDMDRGWIAFFREGRTIAVIRPRDFPVTGS
jgi:hypothetical protein